MTIKLVRASLDHQCWIRAELQSYLFELSQFASIEKNAEGQYDYPYLDHYWREPDLHPFVIYLDNEAVGFLLVREDLDPADGTSLTEIAELYILPAFRQRSVASSAVKEVLGYFPGNWRAMVLPNNNVALSFWRELISTMDPEFTVALPAPPKNQQVVFTFTTSSAAT
jgi:predicted acetyltransferase